MGRYERKIQRPGSKTGLDPADVIPQEKITLPSPPKTDDEESQEKCIVESIIAMRALQDQADAVWVSALMGISYGKVLRFLKQHRGMQFLKKRIIFMFFCIRNEKNC